MYQCRDTVIARLARRAYDPEAGVAMVLALMVIVMLMAISVAVAGVTLSQVKPSQLERKTVTTQNAAEAGFDIALNRIRASTTGMMTDPATGNTVARGKLSLLPCGYSSPTITGAVNGGASTDSSYQVALAYYSADPTGQSASWLVDPLNRIPCTGTAPSRVPSFVSITATGIASDIPGSRVGSGNRVLHSVYALHTNNQNIAGGVIPFYANLNYCFAVHPAVANKIKLGDDITVAACDPTSAMQRFSYTVNLQLQIVATDGSLLCIESQAATQHAQISLDTCSTYALLPASPITPSAQVWSYNDNGQFQASNAGDTGLGTYCLNLYTGTRNNVAALALGAMVDLDTCGAQMVPTASVGAGAAGSALRPFQLVNYLSFGRCIDATNQNVNATWLIGYPCKQDPLATNLTWNQKYYTGTSDGAGGKNATAADGDSSKKGNTVISTPPIFNAAGVQVVAGTGCQIDAVTPCQFISFPNLAGHSTTQYYCLEAGNSANPSAPVNGTIVTVQPCVSSDNYQKWTYTKATYSNYAQQYLIQPYGAAASNLCLTMTIGSTPPGLTYDTSIGGGAPIPAYGYISLKTCNSAAPLVDLSQKWNAPPNPQNNLLKNTFEQVNP